MCVGALGRPGTLFAGSGQLRYGYRMSMVSSVLIGTLSVVGTVSEALEYVDLTTYLFYVPEAQ